MPKIISMEEYANDHFEDINVFASLNKNACDPSLQW